MQRQNVTDNGVLARASIYAPVEICAFLSAAAGVVRAMSRRVHPYGLDAGQGDVHLSACRQRKERR